MTDLQTPPISTTDFLYTRLIGDRSISEKDFGRIQKDRSSEMKNWAGKLKDTINKNHSINLAIVSANNHYAGFGPMTANTFRRMIGIPEAKWEDKSNNMINNTNHSKQLLDFMT